MMDEMAKTLARRRAAAENKDVSAGSMVKTYTKRFTRMQIKFTCILG